MDLIQSWKNSLNLLAPQNCKTFALVTLKVVVDTYKLMIQFWWLWIGIIALGGVLAAITQSLAFGPFAGGALFLLLIRHLLFFTLCLAMRSSVGIKTLDYFQYYTLKFGYLVLVAVTFEIIRLDLVPLFFIFFIFFVFFVLDSDGMFESIGLSIVRALLMVWYNLPLCIIVYALLWLVDFVTYTISFNMIGLFLNGYLVSALLYLFLAPIEIGILSNIYIKKLHEQSDLYFRQP